MPDDIEARGARFIADAENAFAAHTLSLSHGMTIARGMRAAWWRGWLACFMTMVFGALGVLLVLALARSL